MRRLALVSLLTAPACFQSAPPLDDAAEESSSESDSGGLEESDGGSSSSGEPADWMDAYGQCQVDADCELIPGDEGDLGSSPRCVQGTCAIRCADAPSGVPPDYVCPGHFIREPDSPQSADAIICQDGYCTIQFDPYEPPGQSSCPEGMQNSDVETVPDLDCVWEP